MTLSEAELFISALDCWLDSRRTPFEPISRKILLRQLIIKSVDEQVREYEIIQKAQQDALGAE
jgi:hypothetical protein